MGSQTTPDPAAALLAFGILSAALLLLFWPRGGLLGRIRRLAQSTERVRLEDALKHLYVSEHMGRPASIESVAGVMGANRMVAGKTIQRLSERGLAFLDGETPTLSDGGREYAARILRVHRLYERYLADRTGLQPSEWHDAAEATEHEMTQSEAERLSASLGHPLYDPHGDPIPNRMGQLPPAEGTPLSSMEAGDEVEIIHVEDEPPELFSELNAMGLSPHVRLRVVSGSADLLVIELRGEETSIGSIAASNVTVRPLKEGETVPAPAASLVEHSLPGETVVVTGISPLCQGPQRRRLLDLGLVPGTEVTAELVSTGGDPVAYRIRGALIALRSEQAGWVEVGAKPVPDARRSA